MEISLIDGIGPFFRDHNKRRINWSKIPFAAINLEEHERGLQFKQIRTDMATFADRAAAAGYNSVSLDDVAHLAPDPWYEDETNRKVEIYRSEFRPLFAILQSRGLAVYLTMDVLSFTPRLKQEIDGDLGRTITFMARQIDMVLTDFPEIRGIIIRIGECDGKDVKGDFKSELTIRSARGANRMLRELLPIFARHERYLILRNWTVGAYAVGDFIWHRRTTRRVLSGIDSPWFILSMKYGESDFFRYLPLNKHFFRLSVKKIVELQARREYEGCGEYPSFIGWDYSEYAHQLQGATNMAGISVWCQTGGWLPFRRLSFLDDNGFWNELNSFVALRIFRDNLTAEEAIARFCKTTGLDSAKLTTLLKLNDQVIKELLYIPEVAEKKLFFRRVRIPPLLAVYWNNIFINHSVRMVLLSLVSDREGCIRNGYAALDKIDKMIVLAKDLGLPESDLHFMRDTFAILALAREYYFRPDDPTIRNRIKEAKRQYKATYPKDVRPRYRIKTDYSPFPLRISHLSLLRRILLREKRGYRLVDYFFTLHLLGMLYRAFVFFRPSTVPKFARKHAMGIGAIFR